MTTSTAVPSTAPHVALPRSWRRRSDPGRGVVVAARPPTLPSSGVAPEIVLRLSPGVAVDLEAWRADALRQLAARLDAFVVEDDDLYDLDGQLVLYTRFAHLVGGVDVVCDQWAWLDAGTGLTLTCSVAREDYEDFCDVFEGIAGTVEPARAA